MTSEATDTADDAASLLRQRPYLFFWASRFLGGMAGQAQTITIAWQVYAIARATQDVRHAAFAVGMIGLAQFLPVFALTLTAGETADRHDRRLISTLCVLFEVLTAGAFAVLALTGSKALWPIYLTAAAFGAARAFLNPSNSALAPMLVPRSLLPRAIAWNSLAWQTAAIGGPAIGGLLVAISPATGYFAGFALYLAGLLALLFIRTSTQPVVQPAIQPVVQPSAVAAGKALAAVGR